MKILKRCCYVCNLLYLTRKIESLAVLNDDELKRLYLAVLHFRDMTDILSAIEVWIEEIDAERRKLKTDDFMDDL